MTKIKICGITNQADAHLASDFGADCLGFNFYRPSRRFLQPSEAAEIVASLDKRVVPVGVFVNENLSRIVEVVAETRIRAIQLHGDESEDFVREVKSKTGLDVIKAFRAGPDFDVETAAVSNADAVLIDAFSAAEFGGTGRRVDFDIALKVKDSVRIMYLAGGLGPSNIVEVLKTVAPYGIDACSGIESVPGRKDKTKLREFITRIQQVDARRCSKSEP